MVGNSYPTRIMEGCSFCRACAQPRGRAEKPGRGARKSEIEIAVLDGLRVANGKQREEKQSHLDHFLGGNARAAHQELQAKSFQKCFDSESSCDET